VTPFGVRVRELRRARGVTLKQMARDLEITAAYLSALEHGRRGLPTEALVIQICEYFGLIWDDFEDMQRIARVSHPRVTVDTGGLSAAHTELANELASRIATLTPEAALALTQEIRTGRTGLGDDDEA